VDDGDLERLLADPAVWSGSALRRRRRWITFTVAGVVAALLVAVAAVVVASGRPARSLHYAASLASTQLAPGASGHASFTRTPGGWRVDLHAAGLGRRDNGAYYEAWLKNKSGSIVPVGTFNQADGQQVIVLWAGVAPTQFRTLTVTRERADGNLASSGEVVLHGTVTSPD
jgi:hypothetical protein